MKKKSRKLAFYEVGPRGDYAQKMQTEFEQAQQLCLDSNKPVTVVSKITIKPPKIYGERFGQIGYEVYSLIPHTKSMDFITEIENGLIVASEETELDLLQEQLDLEIPDITRNLAKEAVNGTED